VTTLAEATARTALLGIDSYDVHLELTDPERAVSHTEISFRCHVPGATSFVDLRAASVRNIALNGAVLKPHSVVRGDRIVLDRLGAENTLVVDAGFEYTSSGRGISRFEDPDSGETYLLAYGYPTYAPEIFCCFDQLDLRADLTLSVSAPAGWRCASNGNMLSGPPAGEQGLWCFSTVPGMKPCELTVCAGPYASVWRSGGSGTSVEVWCRRSLAAASDLTRAGELAERAIAYYEGALGFACPSQRVTIVFAPALGPMAAQFPGLMLVNEKLLHRVADADDDFVAMVFAHEISHLWFGGVVEGRWWDDLWLAEAIATYVSYVAGDEALEMRHAWAEFGMTEKPSAYRADTLPSREPVSSPVASAADALARPAAIVYGKGASVLRQLAALIGDDAVWTGLGEYLERHAGSVAGLPDIIACWEHAASGRDLGEWARLWLQTPGVNTLRPELGLDADGTIERLAVVQSGDCPDRIHRIGIGMYERSEGDAADGPSLVRRGGLEVEVAGSCTTVGLLAGANPPDAIILNDGDLTFSSIRFDPVSWRSLTDCAMRVGDPITEAVCWNAAWDMMTTGELAASELVELVARRISRGCPPPGVGALLTRAVDAADRYALPTFRPALRELLSAAAFDGAAGSDPGSKAQRDLTIGGSASAETTDQLEVIRSRLDDDTTHVDVRRQILTTLAGRDLVTEADLDAFEATDPVGGAALRATCHALRPDPDAKELAWVAALSPSQAPRLAQAHADGIWLPGQEQIVTGYLHRYFTEALHALGHHDSRSAQRLASTLYPSTLTNAETIRLTDAALERDDLPAAIRIALIEQKALLQQVLAARIVASRVWTN
jgi:aminopeptidase N